MTFEDLVAIEQIKQLKAKYLRYMDQRRWDDWIALFAEDATIRVTVADQEYCLWRGTAEIRAGNAALNTGNVSIHHGHTPDIDIVAEDQATGSWMLFDRYISPAGTNDQFGYYQDEYVKQHGQWRIKAVNCHLYPAQDNRPGLG